ncbi:MAG: molybdate ABC transporter permease subunit [Thermoanaerobaculia bacterium]|nr:molybdate ABC transporter permease subunit [Thermoanaerobaculia bacterium]
MDVPALLLSLELATISALVLLVVGIPVAYWIAFSRVRWKPLIEALVALPLVLPPTVLGFYLLIGLGPRGPVGRFLESSFDVRLAFSFEGLVVGSVIFSLPFAIQPVAAGFSAVDRGLIEASWCLGASRLRTFFRVIVPLSVRSIIVGFVLSFAHTMGEFGVALMIGGNIPGVTRVASIAIYEDVQALEYSRAAATSLVLLTLSFSVLAATYALQGRRAFHPWPAGS